MTILARIYSCAVIGLDGVVVEVEGDITQGFPGMILLTLTEGTDHNTNSRPATSNLMHLLIGGLA